MQQQTGYLSRRPQSKWRWGAKYGNEEESPVWQHEIIDKSSRKPCSAVVRIQLFAPEATWNRRFDMFACAAIAPQMTLEPKAVQQQQSPYWQWDVKQDRRYAGPQ